MADRFGGDLVKLDALGRAQLEHFRQVPGYGLALTVRVGGQDDVAPVLLDRRAKLVDRLSPAFHHLVVRLEAVLHVDGHLLSRQVADVAHRGKDVETIPQEPLQSPRLGGGLDDDQTFGHSTSLFPSGRLSFL